MHRLEVKYIVTHCSATRTTSNYSAARIHADHKARGWSGIGYHYVIERDGSIVPGRSIGYRKIKVGAHVRGHNRESVGVCLIGGLKADGTTGDVFHDTFTIEQEFSYINLLRALFSMFPYAEAIGHRDLSPDIDGDGVISRDEWLKECPTFDVVEFCDIRSNQF